MKERAVIRVGTSSATLRGRWLGARLRQHRESAGWKGGAVAKRMGRSHSTVTRWESGDLIPREPEVFYLLELYGIRGARREALLALADEARQQEDASQVVSIPAADRAWLESRAWKVEAYLDTAVPGLLQTPDYAREVMRGWDDSASSQRIERVVADRMARQQRLTGEDALRLSVILEEAVLRRPLGGPAVLRAQLEHLFERSTLPGVDLRVLPFSVGTHAGIPGAFTILRLRRDDDVAYLETRGGDIYLDDTEPFAQALRRLRAAALPPEASVAMIAATIKETT